MTDAGAALDEVLARLGSRAERDVALGPLTTYRVGGPAAALVRAGHVEDLHAVVAAVHGSDVPILVVGKGSNLLVADRGFDGVVVILGEGFASIEVTGATVRAGGAAALPVVARQTVHAGLTGFEWAVGVPGSIGGAVRMNAGGHGSDMAASLARVRLLDVRSGEDGEVSAALLDLGYRRSSVRADQVVVWAELELEEQTGEGGASGGTELLGEIVRWRREHQPGGANAGSVFTNPSDDSAGRLIDAAGAKGLRIGTAAVSAKHANFIQADDGGSADDVLAVMREVRRRVASTSGVELHAETHLVGFPGTLGGPS